MGVVIVSSKQRDKDSAAPDPSDFEESGEFLAAYTAAAEVDGTEPEEAVAQALALWNDRSKGGNKMRKMRKERRFIDPVASSVRVETRAAESEDGAATSTIFGTGAVFERETELWPGYFELIERGAFDEDLSANLRDINSTFNHNPDYLLGTRSNGTLKLEAGAEGLKYEVPGPFSPLIQSLVIHPLKRGDLTGSSFTFRALEAPESIREDGSTLRRIKRAELFEIGPVTNPQYLEATSGVRSAFDLMAGVGGWDEDPERLLDFLRAEGLTDSEIRANLETSLAAIPASDPMARSFLSRRDHELRLRERALG
jgi:hypothetical protein